MKTGTRVFPGRVVGAAGVSGMDNAAVRLTGDSRRGMRTGRRPWEGFQIRQVLRGLWR